MATTRMTNKEASRTRCFACDRMGARNLVDTRDGQEVFVGSECFDLIKKAGDAGYQPPKGGPRLWLIKCEA